VRLTKSHPLYEKITARLARQQGQAGNAAPSATAPAPATVGRRHGKYNARPTADAEGRVHPSALQARVTDRLRHGAVAVVPEVSMPLSARKNDRIRIDCLVIHEVLEDGARFVGEFVEVKGVDLGEGKQKRRRFEDAFGVTITIERK